MKKAGVWAAAILCIVTALCLDASPAFAKNAESDAHISSETASVNEAPQDMKGIQNSLAEYRAAKSDRSSANTSPWKSSSEFDLGRQGMATVKALLLCIGLLLIGLYLFKRLKGLPFNADTRKCRILERLPVSQKTSLVLLEIEGEKILLTVGSEKTGFYGLRAKAGRYASLNERIVKERFDSRLKEECEIREPSEIKKLSA